MFGFSLSKIVFTVIVGLAVFWVYRQINQIGEGGSKRRSKVDETKQAATEVTKARVEGAQDLEPCPACGAYVAPGTPPGCGKPPAECPMRGRKA